MPSFHVVLDANMAMISSTEEKFFNPDAPDDVLSTMAELFAREGKVHEIAMLLDASVQFDATHHEQEWGVNHTGYTLRLYLPSHLYSQIQDVRVMLEQSILEKGKDIFRSFQTAWLHDVSITVELSSGKGWKDKAKAYLDGEGLSNQGRVHSDNIAPKTADGLLFRSTPEINLYKALKSEGVSFAPLPVFIRGGVDYQRIEPDFIIVKDGLILHVEVDGDGYHQEKPSEAHARTAMLHNEGVIVERINATNCETPDAAKIAAKQLVKLIEKRKSLR